MATLVRNISGVPITLPTPFQGILPPGGSTIVTATVDEVIAACGGPQSASAVFSLSPASAAADPTVTQVFAGFFAPFPITRKAIYARQNGNDKNGDGSQAKPYRTFVRAVQDIPQDIPVGAQYFIDISGIGEETLPAAYTFPTVKSPNLVIIDLNAGTHPALAIQGAVTIWAQPTVIETLQASDITSQVADPDLGGAALVITTNKSYTADQFKGKIIRGSGFFQQAIISNVTAGPNSQIETTANAASFTAPIFIEDYSAALLPGTTDAFTDTISVRANAAITMAGLRIEAADVANSFQCLRVDDCAYFAIQACDIRGVFVGARSGGMDFTGCYFRGGTNINFYLSGTGPGIRNCFVEQNSLQQNIRENSLFWHASILEGCSNGLGDGGDTIVQGTFFISSMLVRSHTGHGVQYKGGKNSRVRDTKVTGATGSALFGSGTGLLEVTRLKGSGNTRYGVELTNGARAGVNSTTDATGTLGDIKVGTKAVRTWVNFRTIVPINVQLDDTALTGDFSRLHQ